MTGDPWSWPAPCGFHIAATTCFSFEASEPSAKGSRLWAPPEGNRLLG
jgi:hypothetical protein